MSSNRLNIQSEANAQCENVQIDVSFHQQIHNWGWISVYIMEGIVLESSFEGTNLRLDKLSLSSPHGAMGEVLIFIKDCG